MSTNGKPVTKTLADGRLVISYDDVPDGKEHRMNQPMPEKKVASQGESKNMVGEGSTLRPATQDEMKAATAKSVAVQTLTKQQAAKPVTQSQVAKSIADLIQKANEITAKPDKVSESEMKPAVPDQDEVSESDEVESLKPEGVKMRTEGGHKKKTVADPGNAPENAPYGVEARVNNDNPNPTVTPKQVKKPHRSGAPAEGTKTPMAQPTTKKSVTEGGKVYVPALKAVGIVSAINKSMVDVTIGKRVATLAISDVMPILKHETLVAHDHSAITAEDVPMFTGVADGDTPAEEDATETSEDEQKDEQSRGGLEGAAVKSELDQASAPSADEEPPVTGKKKPAATDLQSGGGKASSTDGKNLPLKSLIQDAIEKHQLGKE
jgi:hypothetical protein